MRSYNRSHIHRYLTTQCRWLRNSSTSESVTDLHIEQNGFEWFTGVLKHRFILIRVLSCFNKRTTLLNQNWSIYSFFIRYCNWKQAFTCPSSVHLVLSIILKRSLASPCWIPQQLPYHFRRWQGPSSCELALTATVPTLPSGNRFLSGITEKIHHWDLENLNSGYVINYRNIGHIAPSSIYSQLQKIICFCSALYIYLHSNPWI